jgi:hypothetical protein
MTTSPQLPGFEDVWAAQERAHQALGAHHADYDRAVLERQQTEAAFNIALDLADLHAAEAEAGS